MAEIDERVTWPRIVLFGDSLTQQSFSSDGQWGSLLTDHLQRKCDVVNRGFSGYNARWCKSVLPQIISEDDVDVVAAVIIFLGANDSNDGELNPRQHVPLEDYQEDLMEMVEYLQSIEIEREKIILITPPPCDVKAWGEECKKKGKPLSKCNKRTAEYAKACVEAAEECGTQHVDFYSAMMKVEGWEDMLNDGLHLGPKGSQLLFSLLQPVIDKLTSGVIFKFPLWDEIDLENPELSLVKTSDDAGYLQSRS